MDEDETIELKIITLGNSEVGKTSIINRFTSNYFDKDLINTIGMDSKTHQMKIGEKTVNLKIWDSAGQERFRSIQKYYYNQVDGILFVYDITKEESFKIIESWLDEVKTKAINTLCGVLIGNKIDLKNERVVSTEDGKKLADQLELKFIECSAFSGDNVEQAFILLVESILEKKNKENNDYVFVENSNQREDNNDFDVDKDSKPKKENNFSLKKSIHSNDSNKIKKCC